jgi:amidase
MNRAVDDATEIRLPRLRARVGLKPRACSYNRLRMIDRRQFLTEAVAGAAAVTAGCARARNTESAAPAQSGNSSFEMEELTLADLQARMQSGEYTARSIVEAYLLRIGGLDKQGPELRAIIEINPDVLPIADALDAERRSTGGRGPLHGIPILLKDNIGTADRMTTTAGSLALEGSIPSRDSFVAAKLRQAGVILLGKANMSEWANFRSTRSTSGWSARGGLCRNPYVLDRNPCGSSSGSAVAASANMCAVAIGTETDGSIVCPSNANGLVGIKPTVGLVSTAGIIPIAHSQDTAGPITRTVADAAVLLGALSGADYTTSLDANGLKGARIGVARNFFGFDSDVDDLMEAAIDAMRRGGAEIIDPASIATAEFFRASELEVLQYEFKADLNAYLESLGPSAPVKSLREIIEFNEGNREKEMPFFGQELFIESEQKGPLTSEAYLRALRLNRRLSRDEGIDLVMNTYRLDAICAPTGGPAWVTDPGSGDHVDGGSAAAAAVAGYPNITVPAGFVGDLPVGISFFGRARSEPALLRITYAYEQATKHRRPPRFLRPR